MLAEQEKDMSFLRGPHGPLKNHSIKRTTLNYAFLSFSNGVETICFPHFLSNLNVPPSTNSQL